MRRIAGTMNEPWLLLGDFNNVLYIEDRVGGLPVNENECEPFRKALSDSMLQELTLHRWMYSWCNQQHQNLIYTKIDRYFGKVDWIQKYGSVSVEILNPSFSDHSPQLINCGITKKAF